MQPNPTLISEQVDGQAVILAPENGRVVVLNPIGSLIWELLAAGHTAAQIEQRLVNAYCVTPAQARADLAVFLRQLGTRELLA